MSIDWDFLMLPFLACIITPMLSAPIGCILIWRRMTFFGDALAHASLLGAAIAVVMQLAIIYGLVAISLLMAAILTFSHKDRTLSHDSWLGIISYGALAAGLLLLYSYSESGIDPHQVLIGDILTTALPDIFLILSVSICAGLLLRFNWRAILLLTLDKDFATAKQINTQRIELLLMLVLSMTIAALLKIIGALLAPALLIFPAVTARRLSTSPTSMVFIAIGMGIIMNIGGLFSSVYFDCPTGPAIIVAGAALFTLSKLIPT